jgi:uncharacterized protein DUF4240
VSSDDFWSVVESADPLTMLRTMPVPALLRFHDEFLDAVAELQGEPFLEHMVASEDGQEDIAHWVVSQGRAYYEQVLAAPATIPYTVEDKPTATLYAGVTLVIYRSRTGEAPPDPY